MAKRPGRVARPVVLLLSGAVATALLASCGGSTSVGTAGASPAVAEATAAVETAAADPATPAAAGGARTASLTWPQGTDEFALNICTSIGEHTIQGGGNSGDQWNLVLDANLLNDGDTGTLTVSQKSDMTVVYDAKVTALAVSSDGSFTGSGKDAGGNAFTVTGSCDVSW